MAVKPILFSAPMIRALLDNRKTQTRRLLKPQPPSVEAVHNLAGTGYDWSPSKDPSLPWRPVGPVWAVRQLMEQEPSVTPPYAVGDLLWVRERCWITSAEDEGAPAADPPVWYFADGDRPSAIDYPHHRTSIHMPRWASRLTLRVTDVRVHRLQEISAEDAQAEGIEMESADPPFYYAPGIWPHSLTAVGVESGERHAQRSFSKLWDLLNAARAPWDDNPWVAAYTFTVHQCNVDQMEAAA